MPKTYLAKMFFRNKIHKYAKKDTSIACCLKIIGIILDLVCSDSSCLDLVGRNSICLNLICRNAICLNLVCRDSSWLDCNDVPAVAVDLIASPRNRCSIATKIATKCSLFFLSLQMHFVIDNR